ncbi:MAG: hypothetical protein HN348_02470, partial [Proteobacteria bacterium]|nr:hypothetical protein [Pseudomonadota bacterium]
DLEKVYLQGVKATMEDQELASSRRQHWKGRFQWLLAICLLLLCVEPFVPERVGRVQP